MTIKGEVGRIKSANRSKNSKVILVRHYFSWKDLYETYQGVIGFIELMATNLAFPIEQYTTTK